MKRVCFLLWMCGAAAMAAAQVTTVQPLGVIPAAQAANGLGFNIKGYSWEFPLMQALGVKHIRFDCSWGAVEIRNADNSSGGYHLPTNCANVINWSKQYGITPQINALFGPPYGEIARVTPVGTVSSGVYALPVSWISGQSVLQLAAACFDTNGKPLCEVYKVVGTTATQITTRYDYSGSLITAVNAATGTITLASMTTLPLGSGDTMVINQLMYAPPMLPFYAATNPTDPSVLAYINYARYLGQQEMAAGLSYAEVGLWNEPQWNGALWIMGQAFYDNAASAPNGFNHDAVGSSVPIYVAMQPAINGVKYVNNWTNKSGATTMLGYPLFNYTTIQQVQKTMAAEALHPYGSFPEQGMWDPSCVRQKANLQSNAGSMFDACILDGSVHGQNLGAQTMAAALPMMSGGIPLEINETGFNYPDWTMGERFDTRQFLGYQAIGVTPILFFQFSDAPGSYYAWVNSSTQAKNPIYGQFQALMQDINSIAGPPIGPVSACSSPYVAAYSGAYILNTVTMQGTRAATDQQNSILFYAWQKSNGNGTSNSNWSTTASPAAGPVQVVVPAGYTVQKVVDTVAQTAVAYTQVGNTLSYSVADNPVEVLLVPANNGTANAGCTGPLS